MNPLRTFGCLSMLFAVCFAYSSNSLSNSLKPSEWLSLSELEQLPAVNEVTLEQLERMSLQEGAVLANKIYHLSQVNQEFMPSYVPKVNEIQAYILTPNNEKISFPLSQLAEVAKQQPNFGNDEVTIFITGLSQETETVKKANRILIDAYMQRYNNMQSPKGPITVYPAGQQMRGDSSEEQYYKSGSQKRNTGNLIVIDLGAKIDSFEHCATLDVEKTGAAIAKLLVKLTNEADVPQEIIHIVAQGIAAHVAGSAAREYRRLTGHQLRRITALDPSKIFAKQPNTLIGLARGDADFVDAIHTSAYGMGTVGRVGDVDFYPNGPAAGVPGADNILEASMRATRYFAETVRPGNERNFPAVAASSLQDYRQQNGYGRRAYMGISTNFDLEGDYIMTVNPRSPFGKNAPAQKQTPYHNVHQTWNTSA